MAVAAPGGGGGAATVLYEVVGGGVALVTINRPERMNALDFDTARRLYDCYDRAHADAAVRAVVVTGAGRGFCAGADVGTLRSMTSGEEEGRAARLGEGEKGGGGPRFWGPGRMAAHPSLLPKPVVCAVNGYCGGLGLSVALACDVIFASDTAQFAVAYPRRGLIAEHGVSHALPRAIGQKNAMMMLLSGKPVPAQEAWRMGLVQRLFPDARQLRDGAVDFARDLAANVPASSLAAVKQQARHHPLMPELAALWQSHSLMEAEPPERSADFREATAAFAEKRSPRFAPYDEAHPRVRLAQALFGRDEFRSAPPSRL